MGTPGFQKFFAPTLSVLSDGRPRRTREVADAVASRMSLSDADRAESIPSGQARYVNRATWAQSYLFQAGLITRPQRGVVAITSEGLRLVADRPESIDLGDLERFESFRAFRERRSGRRATVSHLEPDGGDVQDSPEERIEAAVAEHASSLAGELLARFPDLTPRAFEALIIRLLSRMGYGTTETAEHTGRSGDEGIDGIIRRDALGLDRV